MKQDIKELLAHAARACGYTLVDDYDVNGEYWPWCRELDRRWHPLDDGDGARLEERLWFEFKWFDEYVHSHFFSEKNKEIPEWGRAEHYADHNGNRQAARRMASLRVAAEIGRRMK